jgi:hypothetical protein
MEECRHEAALARDVFWSDSISDRRDCLRLRGGILDWSSGL